MTPYDLFVSTFRTPSLMLRSNYFDYAAKPSPYFDGDRTHFNCNPQRRTFIRPAFCGEADYTPDDQPFSELLPPAKYLKTLGFPDELIRGVWQHIPRLHVLVQRITPHIHNVTVLLRGDAWWPYKEREGHLVDALKSDEEVGGVLQRVTQIEGFDISAWQRFEVEFNKKYAAISAVSSKRIH